VSKREWLDAGVGDRRAEDEREWGGLVGWWVEWGGRVKKERKGKEMREMGVMIRYEER